MSTPLAHACCARLPLPGLPALGALRARPGLRVQRTKEALWVFWPPGDESTARHLQTLDGAELFCLEGDLWYRPGAALPTFGIPSAEEGMSLAGLLSPEPAVPQRPAPGSWQPARLSLVAEMPGRTPVAHAPGSPPHATALLCSTAALDAWADSATSRQLEGLEAAWSGEQVLVVGSPLPPITEGTRFWGQAVLVPLGWRPEPAVSEPGLRAALGLDPDEIALVTEAGVQVIPRSALGPVRRSGVRVLARGPRP